MESFPVEVIGSILSRLESAKAVVMASATCRKWREARKNYFRARLSFVVDSSVNVESLISWLTYSKDTLRELDYDAFTIADFNIIEKGDLQKFEVLTLVRNPITWVDPIYQKFPCLRRVSLSDVSVSGNLDFLLTAGPNIEFLTLDNVRLVESNLQETMELSSKSLKDLQLRRVYLDKFILKADNIEKLCLECCTFHTCFEFIDKGALKYLKIERVDVLNFDIGESVENLEALDVSHYSHYFFWPKFKSVISRSPKLRRLRIWKIWQAIHMDMETIVGGFPLLTHLSLSYSRTDANHYNGNYDEAVDNELLMAATTQFKADGSLQLQNVVVLELGWSNVSVMFAFWVAMLLKRCPNLKKLVIYVSDLLDLPCDEHPTVIDFTSSMIWLMRKYLHVEVQFMYNNDDV